MKTARFVLKIVAGGLAVGACVCAIIAWWDKIADCLSAMAQKAQARKLQDEEFRHYADV